MMVTVPWVALVVAAFAVAGVAFAAGRSLGIKLGRLDRRRRVEVLEHVETYGVKVHRPRPER